jgi:hypothetical protein
MKEPAAFAAGFLLRPGDRDVGHGRALGTAVALEVGAKGFENQRIAGRP